MSSARRNMHNGNVRIERLLESKMIEADKNMFFSLGFESELPHVAEECDRLSTSYVEDVRRLGRLLLANGCNPRLNINTELTSVCLSRDADSKAPYSAVSVLKYNLSSLKKMIEYSKRLISEDSLSCFDGAAEELNRVILRDIVSLERIRDFITV